MATPRFTPLPILALLLALATPLKAATPLIPPGATEPVPANMVQIAIEAVVVEINEDSTNELGFEYTFSEVGGIRLGTTNQAVGVAMQMANIDAGTFGEMTANIQALVDEGTANIRTRPLAVALNGTNALIETVEEIPYQDIEYDKVGRAFLRVNFEKVGVKLNVIPRVRPEMDNKMIELDLKTVEVSGVQNFITVRDVNRPVFVTSNAATKVNLNDGETLVIGGLKSRRQVVTERRIPIIGEIPFLGLLFKTYRVEVRSTDVLFFITPHLLWPGEQTTLPPDFEHGDIPDSPLSPGEANTVATHTDMQEPGFLQPIFNWDPLRFVPLEIRVLRGEAGNQNP